MRYVLLLEKLSTRPMFTDLDLDILIYVNDEILETLDGRHRCAGQWVVTTKS